MTAATEELRCPVCQAQFRGTGNCSRCGADLRRLMRLVVGAHAARQAARGALLAGNVELAWAQLHLAQRCRKTAVGTDLARLAQAAPRGPDTTL